MDGVAKLLSRLIVTCKLIPHNYEIGSEYRVEVTHINDPQSFYVRPIAYTQYLPFIQDHGEKLSPEAIRMGNIVVFKSKAWKRFARGRVKFVRNNTCDIFAIDHGNLERYILNKNVYRAYYGSDFKPLAIHCKLANCKPLEGNWILSAIEKMKQIINNQQECKMIVKDISEEYLTVELVTSKHKKSFL